MFHTIILNQTPEEATVIQITMLSTQVSKTAYYTVPLNLTNNPFNTDPETVNVGELRLQYQSICTNNSEVVGTVFGSKPLS